MDAGGPPSERVLAYRAATKGCTGCRSFEPVWDAFVAKNAATFVKLQIKVDKLPPFTDNEPRDASLGSSENPAVGLFDLNSPMNPVMFKGPYTYEGLRKFVAKVLQDQHMIGTLAAQ